MYSHYNTSWYEKPVNTRVKQQIDKQLCSIIGTIYASDFKDENGEEPFDTTIKAGNIAEELVRLVYIA